MARSCRSKLTVLLLPLLLTLGLLAVVVASTKPEHQQHQHGNLGVTVSELSSLQSNGSSSSSSLPSQSGPTTPGEADSSEEGDSSEVEDGDEDETDGDEEENEEADGDEEEDEASQPDDDVDDEEEEDEDKLPDELRAAAESRAATTDKTQSAATEANSKPNTGMFQASDEEVKELLNFKRRKKMDANAEEKSKKDGLNGSSRSGHAEVVADEAVSHYPKNQVLADSLVKFFEKLVEDPRLLDDVDRLLPNLKYSRQAVEAQKRLSRLQNHLGPDSSPSTTTSPSSSESVPTKKPKKKKKKKKLHRKLSTPATTATSEPRSAVLLASTEAPWVVPTKQPDPSSKWHILTEQLFGPPWLQDERRDDNANVAKLRYAVPSQQRTIASAGRRPLDDKQRESLEALNSERQALMLKAAREYSEPQYTQPRVLHFGKINTHQRTSSAEDLDDAYDSNERAYQRIHFGRLIPSSTSRLNYPHLGQEQSSLYAQQSRPRQSMHLDVNFARNQDYLPPNHNFAASKPWPSNEAGYRYDSPPWSRLDEARLWNWRRLANPAVATKSWPAWNMSPEYEGEERERAWQQAQRQQNWSRQHMRENVPPWLEGREIEGLLQAANHWPKSEKPAEYNNVHREQNPLLLDNQRNNNSGLKESPQSKQEEDSKESPKLTMKTWNSLTSDPATWPFKLPGAKPWPKDENGKSYNPNAELVRKLGLYKSGRLRGAKDDSKEAKQSNKEANPADGGRLAWDERQSWYGGASAEERASREKISDEWTKAATASNVWPAKWKQFAYHKVTAPTTSKSGVPLDKPNRNAFIAVSAVAEPKYDNSWRKNDIEEVGQYGRPDGPSDESDPFASQMKANVWKKSGRLNETRDAPDKTGRVDLLENQLENLKEPVLLEVNVSIRNSTTHGNTPVPSEHSTPQEMTTFKGNKNNENVNQESVSAKH